MELRLLVPTSRTKYQLQSLATGMHITILDLTLWTRPYLSAHSKYILPTWEEHTLVPNVLLQTRLRVSLDPAIYRSAGSAHGTFWSAAEGHSWDSPLSAPTTYPVTVHPPLTAWSTRVLPTFVPRPSSSLTLD